MKHISLWLPFAVAPLCLWGCNSHHNDTPTVALPQLTAATAATLSSCETLLQEFSYDDTVLTAATAVAAGSVQYSSSETYTAPAHCQITGYMNQRTGVGASGDTTYQIGFEMRLPVSWNGRFYYQANGGLDGSVAKAVGRFLFSGGADSGALSKGFAVISSDAGHPSPVPSFGLDPQARLDYGYNAVAELTPMAKTLIKAAYGKTPDRSYFGGCSNGGRHTMVAATRFAQQYDGFLVGNPGFHLPRAAIAQVAGIQQLSSLVTVDSSNVLSSIKQAITQEELALVSSKVLERCDSLDGVSDGMVNALQACQNKFDLETDVPTCSGERDGTCLTSAQKTVLSKLMAGPQNSAGEALYHSFPYDAGMGTNNYFSWKYDMALTRDPGALGYIFTTAPTAFDYSTELGNYNFVSGFSLDTDAPKIYATDSSYTESGADFMFPPHETDMSTLRNRGAKIMVVHGSSDPVFSVADTIDWFDGLEEENAGDASGFARLYLVPGMNHCGAGPATDKFDMLDSLVQWVEAGTAPAAISASVRAENSELPADWSTTRSRPLCPYPQVATYKGSGSVESADNFICSTAE